jgi:HEAT repeat protein
MPRWIPAFLVVLTVLPASLQAQPAAPAPAAEQSPLLTEPKTPEAAFDAVVLMLDLNRPNLASRYLGMVMAANPDDATILKMRDKHGPGVFLALANDPRFQPQSLRLLKKMNDAFRAFAFDPARIDGLIANLNGNARDQQLAMQQLRATGAIAVPRMLEVISTTESAKEKETMIIALTRMGKGTIPALLGALESPAENVRSVAVETLGWVGDRETVSWLWYPAFGPDEPTSVRQSAQRAVARLLRGDSRKTSEISPYGAVAELSRLARDHFRFEHEWKVDPTGAVELWSWDRAAGNLNAWKVSEQMASLVVGSRFARQAMRMAPERSDLQAQYLALRLAYETHLAGWDKPIPTGPGTAHNLALRAGAELSLEVLSQSLKNPSPAAALAALNVLSQIGSRSDLKTNDGQSSPIMAALNYPDFRVQFAAASTILQFDPEGPFRGSSQVVSILSRAINDAGSKAALAIDPNAERSVTTAAWLTQMGYEPDAATTGMDGFREASSRGDISLIAIHAACIRWGLAQTIANLRADSRTAGIPIIIYGPESIQTSVERIADRYPLIGYAPDGQQSFEVYVNRFLARRKTPPETDEQRNERIGAAGFWFAHIASGRRGDTYDIRNAENVLFEAVNLPQVGENGIIALGSIATATAQERLQEIAIANDRDAIIREAAALQLGFHIQKHSVLIDRTRVLEIQASWQAAANPDLKTALAAVIGTFQPKKVEVDRLLESLPEAAIPTP